MGFLFFNCYFFFHFMLACCLESIDSSVHTWIRSSFPSFASFLRSLPVRSFLHSFACSFVPSFLRSFARSFDLFVHTFARSFVCVHSFFLSSLRLLVCLFTCSFVSSFVHSFFRSSSCLLVCSFVPFVHSSVRSLVRFFTYIFKHLPPFLVSETSITTTAGGSDTWKNNNNNNINNNGNK